MNTVVTEKRITSEYVDSVIVTGRYDRIPGTTITVCTLELRNGTKVVGINYGAIDPDRHNWEIGELEARRQAVDKVFELEGYLLRQRLFDSN